MVNVIASPLALASGNSIVLYQNLLPKTYSITVPFVEVTPPRNSECVYENQGEDEVLYYNRQGHVKKRFQKGLFVNTYF